MVVAASILVVAAADDVPPVTPLVCSVPRSGLPSQNCIFIRCRMSLCVAVSASSQLLLKKTEKVIEEYEEMISSKQQEIGNVLADKTHQDTMRRLKQALDVKDQLETSLMGMKIKQFSMMKDFLMKVPPAAALRPGAALLPPQSCLPSTHTTHSPHRVHQVGRSLSYTLTRAARHGEDGHR